MIFAFRRLAFAALLICAAAYLYAMENSMTFRPCVDWIGMMADCSR